MPEYLAERYDPGTSREQIEADTARLSAAAGELRAEGHMVEFLGLVFVPVDESSLSRFASSSAELVDLLHRRASVPFARIVEAVSLPEQDRRERKR